MGFGTTTASGNFSGAEKFVRLARQQVGTGWVDVVFREFPDWDYLGVAPKHLYMLYNVVHEQLLDTVGEVDNHRRFCVRKARNFRPGCRAVFCRNQAPVFFYDQFSQADLAAIGI
jgi:hypothetical protein